MFIKHYTTPNDLIEGILRAGQARLYVMLRLSLHVGMEFQKLLTRGEWLDNEAVNWAAMVLHWVKVQLSQSYDLPDWGSLSVAPPSQETIKAHFQWLEWWIAYEQELMSTGQYEEFHNDVFVLDRDALDEKWFPVGHWSDIDSTMSKLEAPKSPVGEDDPAQVIRKIMEQNGGKDWKGWSMN